jgi:hypothetical protein
MFTGDEEDDITTKVQDSTINQASIMQSMQEHVDTTF